jgi:hypothetical protein
MGLLLYTFFLRMSVPILQGRLSRATEKPTGLVETEKELHGVVMH